MSRLAHVSVEELPEAQRRLFQDLMGDTGGAVPGPFGAWARSPELAGHMLAIIGFLRDRAALPARLVELGILIAVRHWDARYAWKAHEARGLRAGLDPEVIAALDAGRAPLFKKADEGAVFAFCTELQEKRAVGAATYAQAVEALGEQGVVELTAALGFYTLIAMTVKAFEIPVTG
jgi:4-carboxymuconolactone decarboxylase